MAVGTLLRYPCQATTSHYFVPENGFLYKKDVAAGFLHLFDDVENVLAFITQYTVHL